MHAPSGVERVLSLGELLYDLVEAGERFVDLVVLFVVVCEPHQSRRRPLAVGKASLELRDTRELRLRASKPPRDLCLIVERLGRELVARDALEVRNRHGELTASILTDPHAQPDEIDIGNFAVALQQGRVAVVGVAIAPLLHKNPGAFHAELVVTSRLDFGKFLTKARQAASAIIRSIVLRELLIERLEHIDSVLEPAEADEKIR